MVSASAWVLRSAARAVSGLEGLPAEAAEAEEERPQGLGLDAGLAQLSAKGATGRGPGAAAGLGLAP